MPPKADEALLVQPDLPAEKAGELRGRLADQDARHQGVIGHVAAHPELVGLDVLVADDQLVLDVEMDDRRELFHLEPLRIATADPLPIDQNARGVDGGGVDQGRWRHARVSFLDILRGNTGLGQAKSVRDRCGLPAVSHPEWPALDRSGVIVVQLAIVRNRSLL